MALKDINLRSEEVQDILTAVPNWIIRRGNLLFFIIILGLIGLTFIIEYPDTIDARATVTTTVPAETIVPLSGGRLESILVNDGEFVNAGQDLAIIGNAARYEDILSLKKRLAEVRFRESEPQTLPVDLGEIRSLDSFEFLELGEIDVYFEAFEQAITRYNLDITLNPYASQQRTSALGMNEISRRRTNLTAQKDIAEKELEIAKSDLLRNKKLLDKGVISQAAYEEKQISTMQIERNFKNLSVALSQLRDAAYVNQATTVDNENARITSSKTLYARCVRSFFQLKKAISDWEMNNVLRSSSSGQVVFTDRWFSGQLVIPGQALFRIVPKTINNIVAETWIPASNSGKVELDQVVQLGLDNFPENEFGWLNGSVLKIAPIPNKDGLYLVIVDLESDLTTSYGRKIPFRPEMGGDARLITQKQKLADRIFYQANEIRKNL